MVPLPVQSELGGVKIIAVHDRGLGLAALQRTDGIGHLAVLIAQHRPAIDPATGHQGEHTTHTAAILENDAIPVTVLGIDDGSLSLVRETAKLTLKDHLLLPGAMNIIGTVAHLAAMLAWGIHV